MDKKNLYITMALSALLTVGSASAKGYNALLKSKDDETKYTKAKEYYEAGKYVKASALFESILPTCRGTERGEESLFLLGMSHFKNKDYHYAKSYFSAYCKGYPRGKYAEEAKYNVGYCLYKDSPHVKLDQSSTVTAIDELLSFAEMYPQSARLKDVYNMLKELQEKMAEKCYLTAKLYYDLGDYMGNNYLSAVVTASNAIKLYPDSKYREELHFIVLESKYMQAVKSVESKMEDRYRDALDEYYVFKNEFPESKHLKEAERFYTHTRRYLDKIDKRTDRQASLD